MDERILKMFLVGCTIGALIFGYLAWTFYLKVQEDEQAKIEWATKKL